MIDPSSSIPELIKFIKHSFRKCEFDEVQNTLMEREKSMKVEMEKLVRDCDELKKQVDFLERCLGYSELEKCDLEEKLRESQKRGDELDKMLVQTNEKFEKLRREKHDVENELVRSIGKYEEMDERLIKMGKEIEELRRESLSANKTIEELKAKEIEADRVAQELKRQNNETAPTDTELEKNMQNGEVNPEEDRATESPEFPAISGSHLSVMQSGGEVPAEKTVASSSAAGKVVIVICDSDSNDETRIPDTSSWQTKGRKISTSATPSRCRSLPSSRVEERAGALQKSHTGDRIDSTDSDDSISAGYTNNLIATIESKGNNKKGTAASPPPSCPLMPSRCTTPVVEPRFTWARPLMQGYKCRINQYVRDEVVELVGLTLRAVGGEEAVERFREGPFGHFLDLRIGNSANNALHELMAHELEDASFSEQERWFHIGGTDIVFTAQDYMLVTGLAFTKKNYDPNSKKHEISQTSMFCRISRGKRMKIDMLRHIFNAQEFGDNVDDYLKAANIIFLYHLLICSGNVWIADWVWALVEDVERWSSFPWGAYSYQILCHNMSILYKHPDFFTGDTYHFFGPIWALQIWSYEAIPALGRVCGTRDDEMRFPRCLMWKTHKSTTGLTSFFDRSLQVEPLEVNSTEESKNYYMMFVEWQRGEHDVLFVASKRNATKKLPYAKQMEMFGNKKKAISCGADSGPSKRKHKDIEHPCPEARHTFGHVRKRCPSACNEAGLETEPLLKCCLHGLPCRSSEIDDDAHFARLAQRIAPYMPVDASEIGWIDVLARRLVQMTSGRPSTSQACSSSRSIPATRSHDHFHPISSEHDVEHPTKDVVEHFQPMCPDCP
ncbi:uncharacterized protein LOC131024697 isoform X2 [Salvia miltiorrhiza]|uniref:uncharacterized protein LOC131024697 isoform X2 n=1 Tax=Salvia miltiorrhiza TaxID=226208 RepID=UPI0025AC1FF2|nr:uncharacterized protein LOC131024697 isoform X2 [Salvia miltiorrhiza]